MAAAKIRALVARHSLTLAGAAFVTAANAVAFGDAGYPFLSFVFIGLLACSFLAATLLFAPLSFRLGGRAAAFAIGATYFLDVMFVDGASLAAPILVLLAGYLTYLIAWRGNRPVVSFIATAIGICTLFTLPQQAFTNAHLQPRKVTLAKPAAGATGRPFIHIILDEMGTLALMPSGPFYDDLKARMIADYHKRGFDLFYDTRSIAGATIRSLGNVYAYSDGARNYSAEVRDGFSFAVDKNRELDLLTNAGYSTSVLQSSYLETCQPDTGRCMTYARTGDGSAVFANEGDTITKFGYALHGVDDVLSSTGSVRASVYYQLATRTLFGVLPRSWRTDLALAPLMIRLLGESTPSLARIEPGQSIILHFLLPHFPYVLDAHCRLRPPEIARAPHWATVRMGRDFDRAATEFAYWQQAACTHDRLMAMIDAVLASPVGRNAVILVHGDHGSRILKKLTDPLHQAATREERDYALLAHFAVRGLSPQHDQLAAHRDLRDRVSIVLNAVLGGSHADSVLVTSATH
jgi:hypothetical protein